MTPAFRRRLAWLLPGLVVAFGGAAWIVRDDLARQREAFDTDARIAHRLLSQRLAQQEAILATLALLGPSVSGADDPAQRLPALYPQLLQVRSRARGAAWGDAELAQAEERSRALGRAVVARADLPAGRYWLVQAAEPSAQALLVDLRRMVPMAEWPLRADGPVRVELREGTQAWTLQAGRPEAAAVWRFGVTKPLASESQPFELALAMPLGWAALPWARLGAWALLCGGLGFALAAWQRQRAARQRAESLLQLGQVGRLNALGELAAGMAHELNQPLTALLAGTQAARRLIDEEPPDLDTARRAMDQAAQQARRAAEVVARLRRVVQRPDGGAAVQALPLDAAVRHALDLLEPECARRGVQPRWAAGPAAPTVLADPVALEQILHNLLMNALQALEQVPAGERELTLHVEAAAGTAQATLHLRDSGPGLPEPLLRGGFQPFFTTRPGGLGLGLSLSETLAAAMGGSLACANRAPRGAEFRLSLPTAAPA